MFDFIMLTGTKYREKVIIELKYEEGLEINALIERYDLMAKRNH